jgi:hypothetical protein
MVNHIKHINKKLEGFFHFIDSFGLVLIFYKYLESQRKEVIKCNLCQNQEACKLEEAIKNQGLPDGFNKDGVDIRQEKISKAVYISNSSQQMCRLHDGELEIYYRCPKCKN